MVVRRFLVVLKGRATTWDMREESHRWQQWRILVNKRKFEPAFYGDEKIYDMCKSVKTEFRCKIVSKVKIMFLHFKRTSG